jgi:hypothetical protein
MERCLIAFQFIPYFKTKLVSRNSIKILIPVVQNANLHDLPTEREYELRYRAK